MNQTAPDHFLDTVAGFCREHELFRDGAVLVALSGGGDSVALLDALLRVRGEFGLSIQAAHLNHGVRGDASDGDEAFCRELCDKWAVPLTIGRLEKGTFSTHGESFETAARNRRLKFLESAAATVGAARIATGHTASDLVETVFQRLLRGTGPSGIPGILPERGGRWIRPLLCVDRAQIREYLSVRRIPYREDETNIDTSILRNRIRHKLLPFIREEFAPGVDTCILRLAELARIQETWMAGEVETAFRKCVRHHDDSKILLEKSAFTAYHRAIQQRLVRYCLDLLEGAGRDEDRDEVERILSAVSRERDILSVTASLECELFDNVILFVRSLKGFGPIPLAVPGKTVLPSAGEIVSAVPGECPEEPCGAHDVVIFPASLVDQYGVLTVGSVRNGETIETMRHRKQTRIRDLYTTAGIPKTLRDQVPVVRAGAVPVWIPGIVRSSRAAEAGEATRHAGTTIHLAYRGIDWRSFTI